MIFLDLDDLFHIAERALGVPAQVRDVGLLQSALARPQATALGTEAYPTIQAKAAALLHSLARNHGLVDTLLQQIHCCCVSKHMRAYALVLQRWAGAGCGNDVLGQ